MAIEDVEVSRSRGIAKLFDNLKSDYQGAIDYLNSGSGSRRGCLNIVTSYAETKCLLAWFADGDLQAHKQWAYVAAKLGRMIYQTTPAEWYPAYSHLYALLSDHPDIVNWYRQHTVSYFVAGEADDRDNPKMAAFHGYQTLLALNGKWDLLAQRSEQILGMNVTKDKRFLIDHRFYLALAKGDQAEMESVLRTLTSPTIARVRNFEHAFAFTENLIATHATVFAKIAWRHGFEVELDTPWVPREWLPILPLERYDDPWDFMKTFDLYLPFEEGWADWSPVPGDRALVLP
ncbi:Imm49 family immunity protein [Massilia sp. CF038]|uniref:Imm49 family immunity protein n=1 Tax=Massilia sp. CF038 TaxID=1881045 RepID=UPI0009125A0C|nr:Imm49 family immunity protein [Massilia sp. CF038]SHH63130.1 Immunity protein 49 [Massilia sp. CF038]